MKGKALDKRYFPLILDVLESGLFTVDREGLITAFNRAAERITGYAAEEVIGSQCSEVFRTDVCDKVCPLRKSISLRQSSRNHEVYIKVRDGRFVPISVRTAPLVAEDGRLLGGVELFRDMSQIADLRRRLGEKHKVADIIGKSLAMQQIFELLPLVATSDSTVLISGPSGTGKELVARTIHEIGPRNKKPFVAINCAAIPETLLESELFGYKKGAFTDAQRDKPGRIAAAEGGTLLLDEVGDLPKIMQVKVLRFLQERSYEPLGSNKSVQSNVRLLAATNKDLYQLVLDGAFREDLYYRLDVVQIDIPPLRQRVEDIPLLINHFVELYRQNTGKPIDGFTDEAVASLAAYSFPGNVRELENIIERAFIMCQGGHITSEHLPATVQVHREKRMSVANGNTIENAKATSIRNALERHGRNRSHAAAELGIHRTTLLRWMKKYGIE